MRQVLIERAREVKIAEVPEPALTPETALVRTRCSSLLMENVAEFIGTDPRLYKEGHLYYRGYPYVMDGEVVGEVVVGGGDGRFIARRSPGGLTSGHAVGGYLAGIAVMYATGLLAG